MPSLTSRQEEYLLFFAERAGKGASITAAAEQFQVTKPSACRASDTLEQLGLISKSASGEIYLTPQGEECVQHKRMLQEQLAQWLISGLGISPAMAEAEARKMVVELRPVTIHAILRGWERQRQSLPLLEQSPLFLHLPTGAYPINFQVRKKGSWECSMGDAGFRKPGILIRAEEDSHLCLYPREIEYRPTRRTKTYWGILERLWYRCGGVWAEAVTGKDGSFILSASAVVPKADDPACGVIAIRVRASVNQWTMPESEADLTLDLSSVLEQSVRAKL